MSSTLTTGPGAGANHLIDVLRAGTPSGVLRDEAEISPGLRLVVDPEAEVTGRWSSPAGRLLEIEAEVTRPGRWLALHLTLDAADLSDRGVLGFAARIGAPRTTAVRAAIRSGTQAGFVDRFFDKTIVGQPFPATHLDAVEPGLDPVTLPLHAPWREVVLFLPTTSFRLDLHDLRLFVA